jgi:hypothetical protein
MTFILTQKEYLVGAFAALAVPAAALLHGQHRKGILFEQRYILGNRRRHGLINRNSQLIQLI